MIIYYSSLAVLSAPIPKPDPSFAQAAIATLTLVHAGVIGYAIQQQIDTQSLIGKAYYTSKPFSNI